MAFDPACPYCREENEAEKRLLSAARRADARAAVLGVLGGVVAATEREIAESVARRHKDSEWVLSNR